MWFWIIVIIAIWDVALIKRSYHRIEGRYEDTRGIIFMVGQVLLLSTVLTALILKFDCKNLSESEIRWYSIFDFIISLILFISNWTGGLFFIKLFPFLVYLIKLPFIIISLPVYFIDDLVTGNLKLNKTKEIIRKNISILKINESE